jgi:acid phosphatase class B
MKIAIDLDNTIDATPKQFQSLMSSLVATGQTVVVVTGTSDPAPTQAIWDAKYSYLKSLGCANCWSQLVVIAHGDGDVSEDKAKWCKDNGVDILIDNSKDNARAAVDAGVDLVLVPWATRS